MQYGGSGSGITDTNVKLHMLKDGDHPPVTFTITKGRAAAERTPIILYAKGNNWDLGSFHKRPYMISPSTPQRQTKYEKSSLAEIMAESTGCTVFCFEYPGYGLDDASMVSTHAAPVYMKRMVTHLRSIHPHRPIILWGYSLGAAVTVRTLELLGSDVGKFVNGAVLQSSFVSLRDMGNLNPLQQMMMWTMRKDLEKGDYGLLRGARNAGVPIAWIHGREDRMCPMDVVIRKVYNRYPHKKIFLDMDKAAHNNLPVNDHWEDICKTAVEFGV
jgi:pimeloyl-ACP methyl ester carboxylesterase